MIPVVLQIVLKIPNHLGNICPERAMASSNGHWCKTHPCCNTRHHMEQIVYKVSNVVTNLFPMPITWDNGHLLAPTLITMMWQNLFRVLVRLDNAHLSNLTDFQSLNLKLMAFNSILLFKCRAKQWATVNEHSPVHHKGWMISGQETVFCLVPVP
jgi:hypothetical protein